MALRHDYGLHNSIHQNFSKSEKQVAHIPRSYEGAAFHQSTYISRPEDLFFINWEIISRQKSQLLPIYLEHPNRVTTVTVVWKYCFLSLWCWSSKYNKGFGDHAHWARLIPQDSDEDRVPQRLSLFWITYTSLSITLTSSSFNLLSAFQASRHCLQWFDGLLLMYYLLSILRPICRSQHILLFVFSFAKTWSYSLIHYQTKCLKTHESV